MGGYKTLQHQTDRPCSIIFHRLVEPTPRRSNFSCLSQSSRCILLMLLHNCPLFVRIFFYRPQIGLYGTIYQCGMPENPKKMFLYVIKSDSAISFPPSLHNMKSRPKLYLLNIFATPISELTSATISKKSYFSSSYPKCSLT